MKKSNIKLVNRQRQFMLLVGLVMVGLLSGCLEDMTRVYSGGGNAAGIVSDGGNGSAAFSGIYRGKMDLALTPRAMEARHRSHDVTLLVFEDGTVRLGIEGSEAEGVIQDSRFAFDIRVVDTDNLIECEANALINGNINGNIAYANVSGDGKCKLLSIDDSLSITGSLSASK